jgi:5,10-methylenetetrahydromethanopterin reductase
MIRYTRVAEGNGYDSVWIAEDLGDRDAIVSLAAVAASTQKIRLATCILPVYYRSPAITAMTFAALDELSRGRSILGLGSGVRKSVELQGLEFRRPLLALREYVSIVRHLLSGSSVTFNGSIFRLSHTKLNFKLTRQDIPIYIAARGPKMFQLAGEISQGALANEGFCTRAYVQWALQNMRQGAEKAGRDARDTELAALTFLSVSEDHDKAMEIVIPKVLSLLTEGIFGDHLDRLGSSVREVAPALDAWKKGNMKEALEKVPKALIDGSAICGTPDECAKKMKEFRSAGVSLPIIRPLGDNIVETIELAKNW